MQWDVVVTRASGPQLVFIHFIFVNKNRIRVSSKRGGSQKTQNQETKGLWSLGTEMPPN